MPYAMEPHAFARPPNFRSALTPVLTALALTGAAPAWAQQAPITPAETPSEPTAIPLGTGGVEGSIAPETWFHQWGDTFVRNVAMATLTPVLPAAGKANGAAVIVAPGGGFRFLSMNNEGWEVAQALAADACGRNALQ